MKEKTKKIEHESYDMTSIYRSEMESHVDALGKIAERYSIPFIMSFVVSQDSGGDAQVLTSLFIPGRERTPDPIIAASLLIGKEGYNYMVVPRDIAKKLAMMASFVGKLEEQRAVAEANCSTNH